MNDASVPKTLRDWLKQVAMGKKIPAQENHENLKLAILMYNVSMDEDYSAAEKDVVIRKLLETVNVSSFSLQ